MTRIAVVILNYNGERLLGQFLPSVVLHSHEAEVWVVDNGSSDHSIQLIHEQFPTVKILPLDKNYGFCGGYNKGLKQIEASYYVLLNSDIEVTQRWLHPMEKLLQSNATIAAVQPKILSYSDKNKFEYAGAGGGYIDSLGYPFCRGRIFDYTEEDHGQYNDSCEVFWASGACLMIRSEVYHKFGGLDEDLFAHMEEIDLCWKMNRSGSLVYYCGESRVYHLGAGTLGYDSPRKTYLNFRNGLTLLFKHLDPIELWYKIPCRMALDWVAALVFLLKGKATNGLQVLRAHLHFLKDVSLHAQKRRAIRKQYPSYSRKNIYKGLIIRDFFLAGKKKIIVNNPK
jgi:GT2 family glycosyltransferase